MLATRPQNSCGLSWMKSGPGLNPHSTSAASRIAVVPLPGMPSVSSGTSAPPVSALFAPSGRGHALDRAVAEFLRMLRDRLLDAVAHERSDGRARAGQYADEEAHHRAVEEREAAPLHVVPGRHQVPQALGHRQHLGGLGRLHVAEHLADREDADRDDDEIDAAEELHAAEGESRRRGEKVGAHARDPQADQHGEQRLHERLPGEEHHHREPEHHQREIFGRAEGERKPARAAARPASAPPRRTFPR